MKAITLSGLVFIATLTANSAHSQNAQIKLNSRITLVPYTAKYITQVEAKQEWVNTKFPKNAEHIQKYITSKDGSSFIDNDVLIFVYNTPYAYTYERVLNRFEESNLLSIELLGKDKARESTMCTEGNNTYLIIPIVLGNLHKNYIIIFNKPTSTAVNAQVCYSADNKAAGEAMLKHLSEIIQFQSSY